MFTILPNIEGVQYIGGPPQVKHWRGPDPCDPCGVDAYGVDNYRKQLKSAKTTEDLLKTR